MRKNLCLFIVGLFVFLPLFVSAASITPTCGDFDEQGYRKCSIEYNNDVASNSITVLLTEHGGANIEEINAIAGGEFSIDSTNEEGNVHTVVLSAIDPVVANFSILTFTYKKSSGSDCKIAVSIGDISKDVVTPDTQNPDDPADQKDTGSSLPYIALGTIAIIACGAYLGTKNKSKMYKI